MEFLTSTKAESMMDNVTEHRWRVVSASACGRSHVQRGKPCQDAHHWITAPDDALVVAMADGVSSASLSEVGSTVAVLAAVDTICDGRILTMGAEQLDMWERYLTDGLNAAASAIGLEAACRGAAIRDLATTLILVIATPKLTVAVQVGDGAVVVEDCYSNLIGLTVPPSSENLNQTDSLCSPDLVQIAQARIWPYQPKHLTIFTDGLDMLALQTPEFSPYKQFFNPLFRFVEETVDEVKATEGLNRFIRSKRITEKTDDDVTLFLAQFTGS